jgi:hypothetical protein
MVDATNTTAGVDPDHARFTIVLHTARDQVIRAAAVIADTVNLVGAIGRRRTTFRCGPKLSDVYGTMATRSQADSGRSNVCR